MEGQHEQFKTENYIGDRHEEANVFAEDAPESSTKNFLKTMILLVIDSKVYGILATIVTVYALFGDDVRWAFYTKNADDVFNTLTVIAIIFFTLEIIVSSYAKKGYFLGFFFYLDVIATVSLLFEVDWLVEDSSTTDYFGLAQAARAGRASRAGSKAGRIVRIIRIIRLVRIGKLYKQAKASADRGAVRVHPSTRRSSMEILGEVPQEMIPQSSSAAIESQGDNPQRLLISPSSRIMATPSLLATSARTGRSDEPIPEDDDVIDDDFLIPKESRVGRKLSDITTKRVIVLVLLMLMLLPLFTASFFFSEENSYDYGLDNVMEMHGTSGFDGAVDVFIDYHRRSTGVDKYPLIYLQVGVDVLYNRDLLDELRLDEYLELTSGIATAIFDKRPETQLIAILSILKTVFVCIVLGFGALFFSKDANQLVLNPIEKLIEKVKKLAQNPLLVQANQEKELEDQIDEQKGKHKKKNPEGAVNHEFKIINSAISKITALLMLGFGEAGSEIVASNMQRGGDLDPMIPGRKVMAIFGFCSIRMFSDVTEALEEEIMLFVNEIADILHNVVNKYQGNVNKNIGEAFLLVWKFRDEDLYEDENGELSINPSQTVENTADLAMIAYLKTMLKIKSDTKLMRYSAHSSIIDRVTNFRVKVGFGLHVGWAIEGAIGSDYKIDASYLSPNVNIASRLEAATKQFGVPILLSGNFFELLSSYCKNLCRQVDQIAVKGSQHPVSIYTVDVKWNDLPELRESVYDKQTKKLISIKLRKVIHEKFFEKDQHVYDLFNHDRWLQEVRRTVNEEFQQVFKFGFRNYLKGDWHHAQEKFQECLKLDPLDGPTLTLMNFMGKSKFVAPENWARFRQLTEKQLVIVSLPS